MEKYFDTIDIVFIVIISIYLLALFLFIGVFIIKYFDLDKNKKPDTKFEIFIKKILKKIGNLFLKLFNIIKEWIINIYYKITKKERKINKKKKGKKSKKKQNNNSKKNKKQEKNKKNNYKNNNNKPIKKTYKNNISYVKNNPKKNSK